MTWEQRLMRRLIKGFLWAVLFLALTAALDLPPTWQVVLLCCVLSIADRLLDDLLPVTTAKSNAS